MSGRPVHLLAAATIAAASLFSISSASAGCYSGCGYSYAAPVAYYSAPVVYSYSYSAPVSYAAPCSPCGYSYGYAARPMYVVNQGPAYTEPVTLGPEQTPTYDYGYRRSYPYYSGGGVRWHKRHWYRGYGYGARSYGYRYGAVGPRLRHGYRHHGYRHDAVPRYRTGVVVPGHRMGMREMHRGMHRMHRDMMHRMHGPRHSMGGPRHHGGMKPGVVHPAPRGPMHGPGPQGPKKKMP